MSGGGDRSGAARQGAVVVLAALLAYGAALGGAFVYDDFHSVAANPHIREVGNPLRFFVQPEAFSGLGLSMYRPVLVLSFAVNWQIGAGPLAFKAGNLVLHALAAWLLWLWLRGWRLPLGAATIAAALFACHPLLSEAVNLVSGRSELLLVTGLLAALHVHRRGLESGMPWWRHAALASLAVVACGSKETGALLPALLAMQEVLVRGASGRPRSPVRWWGAAAVRLLPVAAVVLVYLLARSHLLGMATANLLGRGGDDPRAGAGRDLVTQLATMGLLLPRLLLQGLVPVGQSLEPPVLFVRTFAHPLVLAGWGGLLLLTALGLRGWRAQPLRAAGVVLAWATALPWVVIPLNVPLAEHRVYAPMAGLCAVVGSALGARLALGPRAVLPRLPRVALAALACSPFALLAVVRSLDYREERLLWQRALAQDPLSFRAHWALGLALQRSGELPLALHHLQWARWLYPANPTLWRSEIEARLQLEGAERQPFRALALAEELAAMSARDPYPRILLANAQIQVGEVTHEAAWFARAEATALSCLAIAKPKGLVYRTAAKAARGAGDDRRALAHLDTSVAEGLDHWTVLLDRAAVCEALGRRAEAERDVLRAQRQAPGEPAVQRLLERVFRAAPGR